MCEFDGPNNADFTLASNPKPSYLNPRPLVLQDWFFLGLKIIGGITCIHFYFHSPVPGVSVACLAVAAAALSIHRDPNPWQKGLWLLLIAGFLCVELHAIRTDRAEADRHSQEERTEQNNQFKDVRDQQNKEFSATADSLQTAIQGIQSTLNTSNALVRLSQPQAVIHVQKVEFAQVPTELRAGQEYWFNIAMENRGLAPAEKKHTIARAFVAKADNRNAQIKMVENFEKIWLTDRWVSGVSSSGEESFTSASYTPSQEDIQGIRSGEDSIYVLSRVEYSDGQGRWRTDDCQMFQNNPKTGFDAQVRHWCAVFKKQRYPAPPNYASLTAPPTTP